MKDKAKGKMKEKTNVMRILDQKHIPYTPHDYGMTDAIAGMEVANVLGEAPEQVFKTLVAVAASKKNYVFMVPVCKELDLKKAAVAVGEKKIEMLKSKELLPLTGYVHGGCSPIGMKKLFYTVLDESARGFDTIFFSGGKIGTQIEMSIQELKKVVPYVLADIVCE